MTIFTKRETPMSPKSKIIIPLMVLLICMNLFVFPITVYAADEDNVDSQFTVEAEINGSLLRIRAESEFYEAEAVYINDIRFSYRTESDLIIDISSYISELDIISVYAVDTEGNHSNTVLLSPPVPEQPQIPNHITSDGQGEVLDYLMNEDNIEFITISTPVGNVFYLVIDHNRPDNNVYFLNHVTEWDLLTLAAEAELPVPGHIFEIPQTNETTVIESKPPTATETLTSEAKTEPVPEEKNNGGRAVLFIILAIAGAVGFGVIYYLKILKPKREREMYGGDDEEYEETDGFEDIGEVEETDDVDEVDVDDEEYDKEGEETE